MLSCDVIIWDDNTPLFCFSWKLHSLGYVPDVGGGSKGYVPDVGGGSKGYVPDVGGGSRATSLMWVGALKATSSGGNKS